MMLKVFCIYDSKIKDYVQPFYMHHEGEAIRGFENVCNDPNTKFYQYPEDFHLFHLGSFDSATGKFTNLHTPESLGCAIQFKK